MAKRQLTRRQSWRIEKVQEERAARAAKRESRLLDELEGGDLGAEQTGLVIATSACRSRSRRWKGS